MIASIDLWARYNRATDEKLAGLLTALTPAAYREERKSFFHSLGGLHLHYVQTYKVYQGLIRKNWGEKYFVSPLTEDSYEVKADSAAECCRLALAYDDLMIAFSQQVTQADWDGPKTPRTMRTGKTYRLSIGEVITQYQNHTAHHRGQMSQILDEMGVEHDIGGILAYAEEITP